MASNCFMWFHRSSVRTHSTSLLGVSLTRERHCAELGGLFEALALMLPAGNSASAATPTAAARA